MKRITLIALLIASSVLSAEYLSTFSAVRSEVKSALNISGTTYVSDSTLNGFIREAIVTTNPTLRGNKTVTSFVTSYYQNTYSIDTLLIDILSVEWSYNDSVKSLVYVPRSKWYEQAHKETKDKSGYEKRPSFFDFTDDQIFLYPTPTKTGDTIRVLGVSRITGMDTLSSLATVPEEYRPAILKYVIWKVASSKQHPLSDRYYNEYVMARDMISVVFRGVFNAPATK